MTQEAAIRAALFGIGVLTAPVHAPGFPRLIAWSAKQGKLALLHVIPEQWTHQEDQRAFSMPYLTVRTVEEALHLFRGSR